MPPLSHVRDSRGVVFVAPLNEEPVDQLIAELRPKDRLTIASPGGERDASWRLGQHIVQNDISVTIAGKCYSGCALYVALPSSAVDITEGATLLFHNTPYVWYALSTSRPDLFTKKQKKDIEYDYNELVNILETRGIDRNILSCIDRATGVFPVEANMRGADPSIGDIKLPHKYHFAWLSPAVMKHFGVEFDFQWTLDTRARSSFEEYTGHLVNWIDEVEQCSGEF